LEKDRKHRLRDIGDVELLLDQVPGVPEVRKSWPWIGAVVLASTFALIAGVGWWRATRPELRPLVRISAELSALQPGRYRLDAETTLASGQPGIHIALSPDGTYLAAAVLDSDGQVRLATHRLDERTFVPLRGAENPGSPFFSPDGQWIAFFAAGKLRKIPVQGGAPITVSNNAAPFASGSWGDDGNIIAALDGSRGGLSRVPSAGGDATPVMELAPREQRHAWPQVLPGSKAVLFTAYTKTSEGSGDSRIDVLSFGTHERKTLVQGGMMGRYLMTPSGAGYLVYIHENTLSAAPFDAGRLTITGAARAVLDDVSAITASTHADFDFSRNGTFVYFSGKGEPERSIFWLDGTGQKQPLHSNPGFYNGLRFSPDGTHLVFAMGDVQGHQDLWIQESELKPSVRLTSFPGASQSPVWSGEGAHILFAVGIERETGIYWMRSDGAGEPQLLTKAEGNLHPSALSPDGKWVVFMSGNPFTAMDVSIAPFEGTPEHPRLGKMELLLRARGFPMPAFSPDGHWLAYASGDTGRTEVYVQPFPGPGGKVPISTDGGGFPQWSRNGRELFFLSPDRRIMVAEYTVKGNSFSTGAPRLWSKQQILLNHIGGPFQPYALAPDGKRFAVVLYPDGTTEHQNPLHLTFLLNFADELRRRVTQ
jgi:serine/threonine-protein kinase